MLFLMLCVLPTGFICHTVTAFHDKISNCNARREACVWPISFLAGDLALFSIVTYLWYLRNTICKMSVFGGIVQTRRGAYCDREDSEIALSYARERGRIQKTRYQHVRVRYIHTEDCFFHISMFFRCALVKWSQTFLWLAAVKTRSIWLTVDDMWSHVAYKKTQQILRCIPFAWNSKLGSFVYAFSTHYAYSLC